MNIEYFNEYLHYENLGIKIKAKECVIKFISSFENYGEKELWTLEYLPKLVDNYKQRIKENVFNDTGFYLNFEEKLNPRIRNELFEEIVFPVLWNGYKNKNVSLMIWLVKLNQNYYQNKKIWKKMGYKSNLEIIMECYEIDPNNNDVVDIYLELRIRGIDYSIHEWPYGILFGNNLATKDECKILLDEISFLHKLDKNKKYFEYINNYENKVIEYMNQK